MTAPSVVRRYTVSECSIDEISRYVKAHDHDAAIAARDGEIERLTKLVAELQAAILADGNECDHEWSDFGLDKPIECVKCGDQKL